MSRFKTLKEVNELYEVEASFYFRSVSGEKKLFRRYADVTLKNRKLEKIDAYFVLMNPGSCKPKDGEEIVFSSDSDCPSDAIMIEAKSDPTMKRMMQIMDAVGYEKIRIFNLADYCDPHPDKLEEFLKLDPDFKVCIFDEQRREELSKLTCDEAPYIIAWGVTTKLMPDYKKKAMEFLKDKTICGNKKIGKGSDWDYYHLNAYSPESNSEYKSRIVEQLESINAR